MRILMKILDTIVLFVLKLIAAIVAFSAAFFILGVAFSLLGWLDTAHGDFLIIFAAILSVPVAVVAFRRSFMSLLDEPSTPSHSRSHTHIRSNHRSLFRSRFACSDLDKPLETDADDNMLIRSRFDWRKFYAQYTPIRTYYTKVAGVTFKNKDGTDRQTILSCCNSWDEVSLEPFTYRGEPAYAVWTPHGQIGNLSADDAAMISTVYADFITLAEIKEITGGTRGQYYGCNLVLTMYKKSDLEFSSDASTGDEAPASAPPLRYTFSDEMLPAAVSVILETGLPSVSMLQRRLQCGYARAARLIDEMEEHGIISPFQGGNLRTVLITEEQWYAAEVTIEASHAVVNDEFIAAAQWYANAVMDEE